MSHAKKILSLIIAVIMAFSIVITAIADDMSAIIYTNGVDGSNWGDSYAYIDTISLSGVDVYTYEWVGNNCTLKLDPDTPEDATIEFEFTIGGRFSSRLTSLTLNGTDIKSAKKGSLKV